MNRKLKRRARVPRARKPPEKKRTQISPLSSFVLNDLENNTPEEEEEEEEEE